MIKIIDLHCDTIMGLYRGEHLDGDYPRHITMQKLLDGGIMAQCFAVFVPQNLNERGIPGTLEEYFDAAYAAYGRELERNSGCIRKALNAADIKANAEAGLVSAILTVEDCVTLRGELSRLDGWFEKGVRMAALTWNFENSLGYPNSPAPALHALGLKPFGKDCVRRMNELGIIVDVSHLSEGGFWDVAAVSKKPFAASHSCARALCGHQRNLTDEQLKAVADSGGVIGLNYLASFLRGINSDKLTDYHTTYEDVIRHMKHIKNVAGVQALAFGSDYDGISSTMDWTDCGGSGLLLERLADVFTPAELDLFTHENALRVFRDVCG